MVQWVLNNTSHDAVIVSPSRVHHYYYYAKRDVMWLSAVTPDRLVALTAGRPVYLVEDNQTVANPGTVDSVKRMVVSAGLRYETVGSVELFNPVRGRSEMRVYRILNPRASGPSGGGRSRASVPRWDA
jgi:hypothetical protein